MELGAESIASYAANSSEPDTTDFNQWCLSLGKRLLLPRVIGENLEFASGTLSTGSFGLMEPEGDAQPLGSVDLILLPALAVDRTGVRLGKGKGFYDRALRSISGIPLYAVVFDSEIFAELPYEPHDKKVTGAITPTAIHHFQASAFG
ncbi:MAG: hypothetical protein RL068_596 [Actinomycetota bacterium]|jgi:5-formyltetrahydrofolate cyclo-ligase